MLSKIMRELEAAWRAKPGHKPNGYIEQIVREGRKLEPKLELGLGLGQPAPRRVTLDELFDMIVDSERGMWD